MRDGNRRYGRARGKPIRRAFGPAEVSEREAIASVLTCSDLRARPEHVLGLEPGELYVVQSAGCACGPAEVASVELLAPRTRSGLVVVLGHAPCGVLERSLDDAGRLRSPAGELLGACGCGDGSTGSVSQACVARKLALATARRLRAALAGPLPWVEAAFFDETSGRVAFLRDRE